jgi:nucleotide-binding universal stress UspA family protein
MPLRDLLLYLHSYPEPTPDPAIDQAVAFAAGMGAKISALALRVEIPDVSNRISDLLIDLKGMIIQEEAKGLQACRASLANFTEAAAARGVLGEALLRGAHLHGEAEAVAAQARTRDLCLIPVFEGDGQRDIAEAVIFHSGRPCLLFRADESHLPSRPPGVAVVGWDASRAAARAMADAIPLLVACGAVRVLTILDDKVAAAPGSGLQAVRHLRTHGANASAVEIQADGRSPGAAIEDYLASAGAELLVMGAYGHSRLREFMLGGATAHMLQAVPGPLLLSH